MNSKPEGLEYREYLGDGLYVGIDDANRVVLYASDGIQVLNIVFLDVQTLGNFENWLRGIREDHEQ